MSDIISESTPRTLSFKSEVQTHMSLLNQISNSVNTKYKIIIGNTKPYEYRQKRGIFNGIGTIWKSITGNLDASDGEYFNECIDKVTQNEREIENLLKNQISVTTSVIKNFNETIQKLRIDEETFNNDIKIIQTSMMDISDDLAFYKAQTQFLNLCESLMESYIFLEDSLNDIINAITFARIKLLHSSIILPTDLVTSLQEISKSLTKYNLPLPPYSSYTPEYLDIIELEAYQSDKKIIFVLKIPLVEPETYTLYRLYPIPILDERTGLYHTLPTNKKFIARDDDSLSYISFQNLENCKILHLREKICSNVLPYPINSEAICEAQLFRQIRKIPDTCQTSLLIARDYNVHQIAYNLWLISVSDPLPITIKCGPRETKSQILRTNTILKLQPECNAYIGNTRVHAKYSLEKEKEIKYDNQPVSIPYECCKDIPGKIEIPEIKPLKLNKLDIEDLNIAQHKLNQHAEELDRLMNQSPISKHSHWFTILTIVLIILLVFLYCICKCRKRKRQTLQIEYPQPGNYGIRQSFQRIIPRRRGSIHPQDNQPENDLELSPIQEG